MTVFCDNQECMFIDECGFCDCDNLSIVGGVCTSSYHGGENYSAERTCHIVKASRKYVLSDGTELYEDGCSECNGYLGDDDNYCPNCGAKVIGG